MNNAIILFLTLGITIILGIAVQLYFRKLSIKDRISIDKNWEDFVEASSNQNIKQIIYYGDKLLWNQYLKQEYLTEITKIVYLNIEQYPELEQLKSDAYNKQADYNRGM